MSIKIAPNMHYSVVTTESPYWCSLQVALAFTALAAIGWIVFLGGFGYLTTNK